MPTLRINVKPGLEELEQVLQHIRHRLPLAYLRPKTGKYYIDFFLDVKRDTLSELQAWLSYCGWDTEIAE